MTRIHTFHADKIPRIEKAVIGWEQSRHGGTEGFREDVLNEGMARVVRFAKTTTTPTFPTYPVAPANKFMVKLGYLSFDSSTLTTETATFTAYEPAQYRMIYSELGWIPKDLVCRITLHHDAWFLFADAGLITHKAVVTESGGIAAGGSGTVTIWKNGLATAWTVTAFLNWMHGGQSAEQGIECIIQWFPDEDVGRWVITNLEC